MYTSKTKIKVRYVETDKMGIVHHSNYYVYFEAAREDLISYTGISYRDLEETGVMMPLIETHCKYIMSARYNDELIVESTFEELTPAKVVITYKVIRSDDEKLIARGKTMQTFVDSKNFKIINIKKKYPEIWGKLCKLI